MGRKRFKITFGFQWGEKQTPLTHFETGKKMVEHSKIATRNRQGAQKLAQKSERRKTG